MEHATTSGQCKAGRAVPVEVVGAATVLRPVQSGDLVAIEAWDNDPTITALMGRNYIQTSVQQWYRSLTKGRICRAWAIETKERRLIGELELANVNWRAGDAELRICIGEKDCWNKGFGTDAIASALQLAFESYGLQSIYLRVFATNSRAVRVYERFGFRRKAVLQPSSRREDPGPVLLMTLSRPCWERLRSA